MKQSAVFRFFVLSLLCALVLGGVSFFAVRELNESSTVELRRHVTSIIVQTVESGPYQETVNDPHFQSPKRSGANLWVFSDNGQLLASNTKNPVPVDWEDLKKPFAVHDFTFHYRPLRLVPDLTFVKLDAKENTYLLIESRRPGSNYNVLAVQLAFLFFVLGMSFIFAYGMAYIYLQKKSKEARSVLSRLEKGDLKARFEIKRIDEIGRLMQDFNRMAAEIERLVHRVQATEATRRELLEELGHDLRTPLTSLRTSVESLYDHMDQMSAAEQKEFISIIRSELAYFIHLIEDLFFISDLEEPRYKKTTKKIDIEEMLHDELKNRRVQTERISQAAEKSLQWLIKSENIEKGEAIILGDPILIQRLFKNAFDNAEKQARLKVEVNLTTINDQIVISINDDGPGISEQAVEFFGKRRKQRLSAAGSGQGLSLGLGSVIMKTIVELHGGELKIGRPENPNETGASLTLSLPKPSASEGSSFD